MIVGWVWLLDSETQYSRVLFVSPAGKIFLSHIIALFARFSNSESKATVVNFECNYINNCAATLAGISCRTGKRCGHWHDGCLEFCITVWLRYVNTALLIGFDDRYSVNNSKQLFSHSQIATTL